MLTISVPLPADLLKNVDEMAKRRGSNKSSIVREAILFFAEEEAVQAVLRAEREIADGKGLRGDLRKLAKKIS